MTPRPPAPPDEVTVIGPRPLRGRLRVPGDKSISHRALLFGALAHGESTFTHLATGDDVGATARAMAALGVDVRTRDRATVVHGRGIESWTEPDTVLDCANSGTTLRLLCGALAGRPFLSVLTGDDSPAPFGGAAFHDNRVWLRT